MDQDNLIFQVLGQIQRRTIVKDPDLDKGLTPFI